ncbi:N-acetyltransferase [Rhodococcoides trifolii]|uniref:N-acetyltransferase n=1 Tax=Rhodococcoides trifolii TaxID=908250 RepID=A0A917CP06_9NOCA|nr:GNAT family N-acetyltransferase [Rhodococcus trifolii]GGF94050.1 N-acetyltransferase [Rhodococcus trifolii]
MTALDVREVPWDHPDAAQLRAEMAAEVGPRYADREADMARTKANAVAPDTVARTFVVYAAGEPVGHAAVRWNGDDLELKRMFVRPAARGTGVSQEILYAAENSARDAGLPRIILQTGDRQPDAVRLYEKSGYTRIPIFPPYESMPFSNCFEKIFDASE